MDTDATDRTYHRLVTDSAIWGLREIARELRYGYQTVRVWRRDDVLPEPDDYASGRPVWYAGTIHRWAIGTGRMTRDGTLTRLKPTGRPMGSKNRT
jgi:hypothetical protein